MDSTLRYARTLAIVVPLLIFFLLVEKYLAPTPGVCLLSGDIAIQLITAVSILRSEKIKEVFPKRARIFLSLWFCALAFADLSWTVSFYVLGLNARSPWVSLCVGGGYSSAFLLGATGFLLSVRGKISQFLFKPIVLFPLLITIPIEARFLVVSFINRMETPFLCVFNLTEIAAIISSFIFLNIGMVAILSSRNLFWSFASSGAVSMIFADWAMRVEKLLETEVVFGPYEFLWTFGVCICAIPFLMFSKDAEKIDEYDSTSLICSYRFWALLTVFISILLISISHHSTLDIIKLIALGCGVGTVIAVIASCILVAKVQYFSKVLGETISDEFVQTKTNRLSLSSGQLPLELEEVYELIFEKSIQEKKRALAAEDALRQERAKSELAQQVAHDIRSPLTALGMVIHELDPLGENLRILVRSAIHRITDIANHLSDTNFSTKIADLDPTTHYLSNHRETSVVLLSAAIESILSEKRLQYRSRMGVTIESKLTKASYGLFSDLNEVDFKRILSNLINNSVEAIAEDGQVLITLDSNDEMVSIQVSDTGCGMSPEVLVRIGNRGETYGKLNGSGLGLYHARSSVELWGGKLRVESVSGQGTRITMTLPKATPPEWFIPSLTIQDGSTIVVVDDDTSIHQVWEKRLRYINESKTNVFIKHLSTPESLVEYLRKRKHFIPAIFLIDYEFKGSILNGLDLIERLKIAPHSILITSRYNENSVQDKAAQLQTKIVPKELAALIPIRTIIQRAIDCVLIDDDPLVGFAWTLAAQKVGKQMKVFQSAKEFFMAKASIPKSTPIYIDSNLGDDLPGEEIGKTIYELGFEELILATASTLESNHQNTHPWLRRVQGKNAPF